MAFINSGYRYKLKETSPVNCFLRALNSVRIVVITVKLNIQNVLLVILKIYIENMKN